MRERKARHLPVYPIDEKLLGALEKGLPPCAGNALGVDRLAALACGTTDIRRVLAFATGDV
jgi:lysyl-tRNA synthetase class 2